MSVSQAFFFFLRLICVSDRNGLPFSVLSFLSRDPTPESVGQGGRVVGQFVGTVGRCELAVGGLEVCDVAWFPVRRRKRSSGPHPAPYRSYDLSGSGWLLEAGLSLTAEHTILSRKSLALRYFSPSGEMSTQARTQAVDRSLPPPPSHQPLLLNFQVSPRVHGSSGRSLC